MKLLCLLNSNKKDNEELELEDKESRIKLGLNNLNFI